MLLDVTNDLTFQRYLDDMEQRLHVRLAPLLVAGIRLQVNRNHIRAAEYINSRGKPLLAMFYRHIYRDQYRAITAQVEEKAITKFMVEQLAWLTLHAGAKITGISSTLAGVIASMILEKVKAGKDHKSIARELAKLAPELGKKRAAVIARTEVHNASMAAIEAALKYKNIKMASKTWVAIRDARTRPTHAAVGGTTVAFDQPFTVGGAQMMRPGDGSLGAGAEEIVNCRCSILYHSEGKGPAPGPPPEAPTPPAAGTLDDKRKAAAAQAEQYVRDQGRATGVEHLRWVDYQTGVLSDDSNWGTRDSVGFTDAILAAIQDPFRRIEAHHNHPQDGSFSGQDLAALAGYPGLYRLFAHGNAGSRYLATNAHPNAGQALKVLYGNGLEELSTLPGNLAYRVQSHAAVSAVARAGLVEYTADLAPDLAAEVARDPARFERIVDNMVKRISIYKKILQAINPSCPAFIDPPGPYATLDEWLAYLADLQRLDVPGLRPFIREAEANIARLRRRPAAQG
jgi:hypothetical protein